MIDVSGSMFGQPLAVAISLGMYLSERTKGEFKDMFLTFSEETELVKIQGDNVKERWPLWIKTPYGENHSVKLNPGDGMLYKGCERPHWRDPLPKEYRRTWYGRKVEKEGLYYHQVFFHYVLADGVRSHFAGDSCNK